MPCGANVVASGKVTTHTPFQEGSVQAPAGDADLPDEAALLNRLIQRFHARTGVPMLLNTSFGLRPTSSTTQTNPSSAPPRQALDCFLRRQAV